MAAAPAAPTGATERAAPPLARAAVVALSAYFVVVWGAGFVASRIALEHAAPFTYIGIRYGLAFCVAVVAERALAGTATLASVLAVVWALLCVTGGTLYQREFCAGSDLRAAVCIHFAATALVMLPLGVAVESFAIAWSEPIVLALAYHVVLGSIGAFSILHLLMRH